MKLLYFPIYLILSLSFACNKEEKLSSMPQGGHFQLTTTQGENYTTENEKIKLIYFGYTFCPDICPTTLSLFSTALKELTPKQKEKLHTLFITIDPKRDTKKKLQEYAQYFDPSIISLTGSEEQIKKVSKMYGVNYQKHYPKKDSDFYVVDHTTHSFLVDKDTHIIQLIPHHIESEELINILNQHL